MDSLKFVCSWQGTVRGARLSIKIGGLQLEGCTFDGTRLAENQRDSATVSSVPNCVVAWISKVCLFIIIFYYFNNYLFNILFY